MRVGEWVGERGWFRCLRDVYLELTCRAKEVEERQLISLYSG